MQEEDPNTGERTPPPTDTQPSDAGDPPEGGGSKTTPQPIDGDPPEGGGVKPVQS